MKTAQFRFGSVGTPESAPEKPGGSVGTIYHLASKGLHALELGWVRSVRVSTKTCAAIKAAAQESNVALSIHAPYYINLHADADEWPKSRKRLMDAAHFGHLAGATDIVFHPGSYFGEEPEAVLNVVIPRLRECMAGLREQHNPVRLRPETMGKATLLGSLEDSLRMAAAVPGVEPCLDFAHLHARRGDGSLNTYAEWCEVFRAYQDALGTPALQRLHCHISGIEYTPRGEKKHLLLAESDFDLTALLKALIHYNCGGRILCESPGIMDVEALVIKQKWLALKGNQH
ncbi:MAG: TIM barrel protein [Anaerolineales bacterium]|nr:TIM barrel protein [Anaerolineales bacterium]